MFVAPLTELSWAYQLHYYLCFRTYRRQQLFASKNNSHTLLEIVNEICSRHDYHLLQSKSYADQLRSLVSLRPDQSISDVVRVVKTNAARECRVQLKLDTPVWARGFLARSIGRMRISAVRQYLAEQAEHHGYAARLLPPIYSYRATRPDELRSPRAVFDLNYHIVFATFRRKGIFTSGLGQALADYWLNVAAKRGFAIDQLTIVPDHIHLLIRTLPSVSIEQCALSLLNNGQHLIVKQYPQILIDVGLRQLWQPSSYAGTCGVISTALMKKWLSE
ncbi:MAG TPA: IS200/IS605 family transposase [Pyrinomonadaceae bacterium]|nr:IS200/IS605 family transposase [Pyrinomonadaceae bacterium]